VSLYTRTKNDEGKWRYNAIPEGRGVHTGSVQPPFYARPRYQGRQIWMRLDATNLSAAHAEAAKISSGFDAKERGLNVTELNHISDPNRLTIQRAVDKFLKNAGASKKRKTLNGYKLNLQQFVESTPLRFLDQITGDTIRNFRDSLHEDGYVTRTQHNRVITVLSLLKKNGIKTDFSMADDLQPFQEVIAVPYSDDQLDRLFAAMDQEEQARYKFFLGTGCRDKEVTYAAWDDIDFDKKTYHVRAKPDVGFSPKNHEDRVIPMPTTLAELLRARKKTRANPRWLFVNEDGRPDNHFLRKLKRIAFHAGLNCGECKTTVTKGRYQGKYKKEVTCKTDPVCEQFYLHRFRKTCATRWHEKGIPMRNIQVYLAHKSLETTQIYLGVASSDQLRDQIDDAFGG
jgi:integrase/recombinase XerD